MASHHLVTLALLRDWPPDLLQAVLASLVDLVRTFHPELPPAWIASAASLELLLALLPADLEARETDLVIALSAELAAQRRSPRPRRVDAAGCARATGARGRARPVHHPSAARRSLRPA